MLASQENGLIFFLTQQQVWQVKATQSCLTNFQVRRLWGSLSLLQGIFPTQGSNPGILHCRQILYHLNHQGSLYGKADVCLSFIRCVFWKYFLLTVAHLFILVCVYHRAEFKISVRPNSSIFSFTDLTFGWCRIWRVITNVRVPLVGDSFPLRSRSAEWFAVHFSGFYLDVFIFFISCSALC